MSDERKRAFAAIAIYALIAILVVPIFPHFVSPNEFTRWTTAVALVEMQTFEVTELLPLLGGNMEDVSVVQGHYYSNKAPGGVLAGLPAYAIARAIAGPPSPGNMRVTLSAMRLLASTVPLLLLALLLVRVCERLGGEQTAAAVVALLFGTPLFAYGLLNFAHALTAAALFAAWALLFAQPSEKRDLIAGALIGLAVLSEYPAAIAGAVLVVFAATDGKKLLRVIAGGLPFAVALAVYNRALFGSAFSLSSGFERDPQFREMAKHGVFGVGLPDPVALMQLLFGPTRGLFVFSPILLLALFAAPRMRNVMAPRMFWSLVAVPAVVVLFYSGYPNWHGGWTVGARYLVPALPFLAVFVAFARPGWLSSLLIGASVLASVVTSIVFPFVPPDVALPWGTFAGPLMSRGLIAPNLLHLAARPLAIAVPLILCTAAILVAVRKRAMVVVGAVVWMLLAMLVPVSPRVAVQRAFIEEVYFERTGAIDRATPAGARVSPALLERARSAKGLPPPSWPF